MSFCRHIITFLGIKRQAHSVGWGESSLTFASQQGGGHVLIVPIKSLKKFLAHSVFYKLNSFLRSLNFSVDKSHSVLVVLLLQLYLAGFDRKKGLIRLSDMRYFSLCSYISLLFLINTILLSLLFHSKMSLTR